MASNTYRKSRRFAPHGFFECEGRGLKWLAQAQASGGVRVVDVYGWCKDWLDIERVERTYATSEAARSFGAGLARMHDYGADCYGQAPDGYAGTCYFGPLDDPVVMDSGQWENPAQYYGEGRLIPMVQLGIDRRILTHDDLELTRHVIRHFDQLMGPALDDTASRIHGDLWSGNVMWTADRGHTEAVLIDPAAHGGHREEDLAMLHLFGMSYLTEIMAGYQSVHPLAPGFKDRITLWRLYPIAGHCVFFAGGYVSQYRSMCRSLLQHCR